MSALSTAESIEAEAASWGAMITQASSRQAWDHPVVDRWSTPQVTQLSNSVAVGLATFTMQWPSQGRAAPPFATVQGSPASKSWSASLRQVDPDVEPVEGGHGRVASAGLVWSSGAKASIFLAWYQYKSRSAMLAPWSCPVVVLQVLGRRRLAVFVRGAVSGAAALALAIS